MPYPDSTLARCGPLERSSFGSLTVAAQPRKGPISHLGLALGYVLAPRLGANRAVGLPDDVELAVAFDLANVHRLVQVVVGTIHGERETRGSFESLSAEG